MIINFDKIPQFKNIFKDVILVFILQTMVGVAFSTNIDLTNRGDNINES